MASMLAMPNMNDFASNFGERTVAALGDILDDPHSLLSESRAITRTAVPNYQMELDILSASSYPQAPLPSVQTRSHRKRTTSQQLFGGIMMNDVEHQSESSNNSPPDERQPPKKKTRRATKGSGDDEASRKLRGRPRLDTQDETAADRRRTQIRLAQRAYRHRKETTISALKQKVGEMESTIEQMNKTFAQLHDNLFDSGILASKPALAQQLKATTEQFVALAKAATAQDSENEEESNNIAKLRHATTTENFLEGKAGMEVGRDSQAGSAAWGYEFSAPEQGEEEIPQSDFQSDESDQINVSLVTKPSNGWTPDNQFQQFNVQIPEVQIDWQKLTAEIERPLHPSSGPYTYSFQETTFARRLHRMSLETAYRHLTNPKSDPGYINRAFKFTFCFSNRKRMLVRFQELLKRKAGESLENWDVPFVRIGGAGTHFPRHDESGNPIYPPNMISPARLFGPQIYISPETPRIGESVEEMLENIGFGGEWFDAHDVEEYLKTKGIYLDGSSSFVDVDPSVIPLPALTRSSPSGGSMSSRSATKTPEPAHTLPLATNIFTSNIFNNNLDMVISSLDNMEDKSDAYDGDASLDGGMWNQGVTFDLVASPGYAPTFQELLSRKQAPVSVDVNKFLNRLVEDAGTCLGRAPGYRREMVDNALALSLQEAF